MRYKGKRKHTREGFTLHSHTCSLTEVQILKCSFSLLKTQHTGEQNCIRAASGSSRFNHIPVHLSQNLWSCGHLLLRFNTLRDGGTCELPSSDPTLETFRADEQEGGEMFALKSQISFSLQSRVSTLVGHSMCTLAAVLVNETMAL